VEEDIALGCCRLAIVDIAGGRQPMWNESRSILSVCNGEIFNHSELRSWLNKRGHALTSNCDVEVLPHLYEEDGAACVERLNGQFAFVIYDRQRRRLFAARDHFGVVPLFFAVVDGLFLFGSEIKALLQHPMIDREVNLTGLDQILCFPGLVSPHTMFAGINSLGSGHSVSVSRHGVEIREYWDLDYPIESADDVDVDEQDIVDGVREHLRRAVSRRLMSDVPVGLYLSGGVDSAIVAAYARAEGPVDAPQSFGISFGGDEMCERRYQEYSWKHVGTTHHDISFGCADVLNNLQRVLYHTECPVRESYNTASLALSEAAKANGVSVVLTGQGADELFGGYIGYRFDSFYSHNPECRQPTDHDDERREGEIRRRLWGDPAFGYDRDYCGLERLKNRLYSKAVREALPRFDCLQSLGLRKDRLSGRHVFHKRSYLDFKLRLADHLLGDHGDRMAMANAVETRHPFLDIDLVNFVSRIPPQLQLKGMKEKYLLRLAAQPSVPRAIVNREKFGWFAYGSPHLLRRAEPAVRDVLSPTRVRRQGYFDPVMIEELLAKYAVNGFELQQPFEADLLLFALTFTEFVEIFELPWLS
jgi:asparagine synthase (glutamine-hydrolysing)